MSTVLELLVVLGLMVLVHELGHFIVAKCCGVRVETFAIGFGKKIVGIERGGTNYQINALPLGGYVKMAGEIPGEEVTNDPGELNNHPRWQRMLIALAGPAANFVLAFVLMACVYMVHNEVDEYFSGPAVTDYISQPSPIARTGIQSGDTIVHFDNVENPTWDDVGNHCLLNLNQTVPFSYVHDGWRFNTTFFVASTAATPDDFSPDTLGFVPKMQPTPVKVSSLLPGSPADRAGLQPGDQIVSIDALASPLRRHAAGLHAGPQGRARRAGGAAQGPAHPSERNSAAYRRWRHQGLPARLLPGPSAGQGGEALLRQVAGQVLGLHQKELDADQGRGQGNVRGPRLGAQPFGAHRHRRGGA